MYISSLLIRMEISSEEHIVIQKDDNNVFDLKIVHECFVKCEENDLDLAAYIEAYNNLTKYVVLDCFWKRNFVEWKFPADFSSNSVACLNLSCTIWATRLVF